LGFFRESENKVLKCWQLIFKKSYEEAKCAWRTDEALGLLA
jgi:hypothetical protein